MPQDLNQLVDVIKMTRRVLYLFPLQAKSIGEALRLLKGQEIVSFRGQVHLDFEERGQPRRKRHFLATSFRISYDVRTESGRRVRFNTPLCERNVNRADPWEWYTLMEEIFQAAKKDAEALAHLVGTADVSVTTAPGLSFLPSFLVRN